MMPIVWVWLPQVWDVKRLKCFADSCFGKSFNRMNHTEFFTLAGIFDSDVDILFILSQ
jgi:hypothetical protein